MLGEVAVEEFVVEPQVLNARLAEFHVRVTQPAGDFGLIAASELEHLVIEIHADHAALAPNALRENKAGLPAAAAEIHNRVARHRGAGGIATAVVALDDFFGNGLEEFGVIIHRRAEAGLRFVRSLAVARAHRFFYSLRFARGNCFDLPPHRAPPIRFPGVRCTICDATRPVFDSGIIGPNAAPRPAPNRRRSSFRQS